jgi:hypothetical protein
VSRAEAVAGANPSVRVADPQGVVGDAGEYDSGWFCIRTEPFPCPATGCEFVAAFMTAAHLVVVFPSVDDLDLLTQARNARDAGRNPRIVEYEPDFGAAISWDAWVARGCPVHAYSSRSGKDGYDRL